eukprot:1146717-Pelagomonas_calceolata.AAC.8
MALMQKQIQATMLCCAAHFCTHGAHACKEAVKHVQWRRPLCSDVQHRPAHTFANACKESLISGHLALCYCTLPGA